MTQKIVIAVLLLACSGFALADVQVLGDEVDQSDSDAFTTHWIGGSLFLALPSQRSAKADGGHIGHEDEEDPESCVDPADFACYSTGEYVEPYYRTRGWPTPSTIRCAQLRLWIQAPVKPECNSACPARTTMVAFKDVTADAYFAFAYSPTTVPGSACEQVMLQCPYSSLPACPPLGW
ncbi:MAG: hypothetical protein AAGE94_14575 [Acidobacteriota bacterium]